MLCSRWRLAGDSHSGIGLSAAEINSCTDTVNLLNLVVIQSFADAFSQDIYDGVSNGRTKRYPASVLSVTYRKLDMLNAAHVLSDLASPPGNRLESLRGDLAGRHSIRINDQFRILFRWTDAGPADVKVTDDH